MALVAFEEAALAVLGSEVTTRRGISSPIDQGRMLLDQWRRVYERDLCVRLGG
jgi:hypothetical protein